MLKKWVEELLRLARAIVRFTSVLRPFLPFYIISFRFTSFFGPPSKGFGAVRKDVLRTIADTVYLAHAHIITT